MSKEFRLSRVSTSKYRPKPQIFFTKVAVIFGSTCHASKVGPYIFILLTKTFLALDKNFSSRNFSHQMGGKRGVIIAHSQKYTHTDINTHKNTQINTQNLTHSHKHTSSVQTRLGQIKSCQKNVLLDIFGSKNECVDFLVWKWQ